MRIGTARRPADPRPKESDLQYAPPRFVQMSREELRGFERVAVSLGERINTSESWKRFSTAFMYQVPRRFVVWATRHRWRISGIEHIAQLNPKRGVILVSNHLSFFDMYVASAAMFTHGNFIKRLYFPVRSSFFYDAPAGAFVNYVMSGYAMWPPVFRDERRQTLNPQGLAQMAHVLAGQGAVLGIHPEGTRNKGTDPYTLGSARPGVGRLVELCDPDTLVLPFFIVGLSNDIVREVRARVSRKLTLPPIRIQFAEPRRCEDLREKGAGPQQIAARLLGIISELGEADRQNESLV